MFRQEMAPVNQAEQPFLLCDEVFLRSAEREMAAFVGAVIELYGLETSQLAAEYWIEQLNRVDWPNREGLSLRQVTIAAASQLAKGKKPVSSASGVTCGALPEDAPRPALVSRNSAQKRRATRTRPSRLRLVNTRALKMQDYPLCQMRGISHDMRNYLCAVYASVELMSGATVSQEARNELLEDVHSAICASIDILDSLLMFSQSRRTHDLLPHSLNQLVVHVVKMVRIHPDARNVELSIADQPIVEICMDRAELGRAIYNLLLNACQAANQYQAAGTVQIAFREEQSKIQIRVTDSGPGVPETVREISRTPPSDAESMHGIGIGLTIAQSVASRHGGFVEVERSTPGSTVFVMHISDARLRQTYRPCLPAILHEIR